MQELDQVPLSQEVLGLMRHAAETALEFEEPFVTPRSILLALLDDTELGPALATVVNRDRVLGAHVEEHGAMIPLSEERMESGEQPAMIRYDTIAFKTPDGRTSVWLDKDAYKVFIEGAQRVEERYLPKHVALGLAAQAIQAPGVLAAIRVEPGVLADAVYKL